MRCASHDILPGAGRLGREIAGKLIVHEYNRLTVTETTNSRKPASCRHVNAIYLP